MPNSIRVKMEANTKIGAHWLENAENFSDTTQKRLESYFLLVAFDIFFLFFYAHSFVRTNAQSLILIIAPSAMLEHFAFRRMAMDDIETRVCCVVFFLIEIFLLVNIETSKKSFAFSLICFGHQHDREPVWAAAAMTAMAIIMSWEWDVWDKDEITITTTL